MKDDADEFATLSVEDAVAYLLDLPAFPEAEPQRGVAMSVLRKLCADINAKKIDPAKDSPLREAWVLRSSYVRLTRSALDAWRTHRGDIPRLSGDEISEASAPSAITTVSEPRPKPVTEAAIIRAFRVKTDDTENAKFWKKLKDCSGDRYGKLREHRAIPGTGRASSTWRPDGIARWLIEHHKWSNEQAARALRKFPDALELAELLSPSEK